MPRATRNTNTNNGSEASAPAKPSTCRNTSELMPREAPNDSTTVAIRISGERIARSSTISTIITTISTSGMISRLSRADACSMSALIAGRAADQGVGSLHLVHGGAHVVDRGERGLRRRVGLELGRDQGHVTLHDRR